jgi:hypothetical protein
LIVIDVSAIRSNFSSISSQFFLTCAFPSILAQLANVTATINYITTNLATITAKVTRVRSYFAPICPQLATLVRVNVSILRRCNTT